MALKYTLTSSRRESRPRSKRLRALGVSAVMAAAVPGTSAVGHTHGNLSDLDRISTDSDGYIHLSSSDGDGQSEKAKAGYADMAYDLAPGSPTKARIESFIGAVESMFAPADATGAELPWADVGTAAFIKAKKSLFSIGAITAKGINGTQEGDGSGEGGASYGRLDEWTDYTAERAGDVLSAKLGWELHTRLGNVYTKTEVDGKLSGYYAKTEADSRFQPKGDYLTQHQSLTHLLRIDGANGTWAGVSALIGKLSDATAVIEDATLLVTSHVDPSSTSMFYRRPASALWDYVKAKADALYQPKGNYLTTDGYPSVLDGRYVNAAGDTMTGPLTINYATRQALSLMGATGGNYMAFGMSGTVRGYVGRTANGTFVQNDDDVNGVMSVLMLNDNHGLTFSPTGNEHYSVWHAGNDGSDSGLDADMLDGVQGVNYAYVGNGINFLCGSARANITTAQFIEKLTALGAFNRPQWSVKCTWSYAHNDIITDTWLGNIQLAGAVIEVHSNSADEYTVRITTSPAASVESAGVTNAVFIYRNHGGGYAPNWKRLANTSDNVASATKLQTARTLWGRPFDGTGNVSGDMAGVGSLSASGEIRTSSPNAFRAVSGNYGFFIRNDGTDVWFMLTESGNQYGLYNALRPFRIKAASGDVSIGDNAVYVGHGGCVGVKTTAPAYPLDINGTVRATTYRLGDAELVWDSANKAIHVKGSVYADGFITAKGVSSTSQGSDSGGSDFGLMKTWPTADPGIGTMDALGANLGWQLYTKASANASSISSLSSRITALEGKNYLDALTLAQSGTGNAVTSVSLSADKKTLTVVKGTTFLTSHQSLANYYTKTETQNNFARALYDKDVLNGDMNTMLNNTTFLGSINATANTPNGNGWYNVIQVAHRNGASDGPGFVGQIALGMTVNHEQMFFRTHRTRAWQTVLTTANYAGALDSRYVTLSTAQTISGAKTFTATVTEFAGRVQVNGATTNYDTFPELMLHIPGKAYSKFKMDSSKLVHLLDGGDTSWSQYQSLKALSFIKAGGTASQFLMADGSVTGKASASTVSSLGWSDRAVDGLRIPDMNMLAFWNGAYAGTSSNLAYCDRGRFGDIVTHAHSEYVTALGTSGDFLTWTRNGAVNKITVPFASNADMLDGYHYNRFVFESDANHVPYAHIATATTVQNHATNAWTTNYLLLADISDWDDTSTATQRYASFTGRIWTFRPHGSAEMYYGDVIAKAAKWGSGENQRNTVLRSNNMQFTPCVIAYNGKTWLAVRLQASFRGDVKLEGVMYGLSPVMSCVEASSGITETLTMETVGYGEAASAERLRGTYSLWGQSFYGNNVKGNIMSDYFMLNDVAANPYLRFTKDSVNWHVQAYDTKLYLGTTHTKSMSIDKDGNVGIGYGATNPAYALDVNGDIRAMGWLRLGTWGRMCFDGGAGWLQMAPSVTNRITALNNTEMTRLEIKSAMTAFSGQITNANSAGNSTTIAYGAIELSHPTPYIDFHFGRSAEDFDVRLINDEAGVLHLVGGSLKLGNGYIRWDSTKGCFAFSHGLYSESFITAKAVGSTTADASDRDDKEIGGAIKVQSDEPEQEDTELEALRLRVAQLEQRINALTA